MIAGRYTNGEPQIVVTVYLPRLDLMKRIVVRVDTGTSQTRVSAQDLDAEGSISFPPDDSFPLSGEGRVLQAVSQVALLAFDNDDGSRTVVPIDLSVVNDAPGESRLGRDILNDWLMIYDQPGDSLLFEPLT